MGPIGWLLLILSGLGRLPGEVSAAETPAGELGSGRQTPLFLAGGDSVADERTPMHSRRQSRLPQLTLRPPLRAGQGHRPEPATHVLATDAEASAVRSETAWRRTRGGWERPSRWTFHRKSRPPALHPIVVGLLEMFLASAALIAFSETGDRRSQPKPKPVRRPDTRRR